MGLIVPKKPAAAGYNAGVSPPCTGFKHASDGDGAVLKPTKKGVKDHAGASIRGAI